MLFYFFFFQAEDGIRDTSVTGVQTCALPIFIDDVEPPRLARAVSLQALALAGAALIAALPWPRADRAKAPPPEPKREERSEERRVGKECRCRWSPEQQKKREEKECRDVDPRQ